MIFVWEWVVSETNQVIGRNIEDAGKPRKIFHSGRTATGPVTADGRYGYKHFLGQSLVGDVTHHHDLSQSIAKGFEIVFFFAFFLFRVHKINFKILKLEKNGKTRFAYKFLLYKKTS